MSLASKTETKIAIEEDMAPYLAPTRFIDSDHPDIIAFAKRAAGDAETDVEKAINIYYVCRDEFRYDPYSCVMKPEAFVASTVLASGRGWCVTKAVLLAAALRAAGIPARLGFADVKNHLSTANMRDKMKTDLFYWHGYTSVFLNGKWVKATPAFNLSLCEKFRLKPLEFDGTEDSIYHPFDEDGNRHMEYVGQHGEFADLPLDEIMADFRVHYPYMFEADGSVEGDFDAEVAAETAR
jgi:transglutaminase-like putative cysteine protease